MGFLFDVIPDRQRQTRPLPKRHRSVILGTLAAIVVGSGMKPAPAVRGAMHLGIDTIWGRCGEKKGASEQFEMNSIRILVTLLAFLSAQAFAAPRFADFQALAYAGHPVGIQLHSAKDREYASILRKASRQPVNFSGRYVLTTWGCGASCVMGAAIDAKSGAVTWIPFTVCCWDLNIREPLEYRGESRLLIVHGSLDEKGAGSAVHYYDFDGQRFAPVAHFP